MDNYNKTFQVWDKVALMYQEKFMEYHLYDDTYDTLCQQILKSNPKILEIGCGPGNITKYILSKRPDFIIEGIDTSANMINFAKENNPSAEFHVMDCREIDMLKSGYDAIICGFCLPYLSKYDVAKLIKDCSALLNNNGIFYFSFIEGEYQKSDFQTSSDGEHTMFVYYHQEDYLRDWLKESNFQLINFSRKKYIKSESASESNLIFIAKKLSNF